ncbi:MAG: electron transport complex subunit E [Clostridia bacterium]|nr:electron transport complex subunit E [Clostridia bacterium]
MEKTNIKKIVSDGLLYKNPILVQLLGICATLAVTTSVTNGIAMGLSTTAVLVCSNLFISLLRKFIMKEVRIASYIVVISGFVTAVELLIKAFLPEINKSLGVFIPLIVVNCIILSRAESFASKNSPLFSVLDGLFMGLGFTAALICVSAIRELIGAGSLLGYRILPESYEPALIFIMSAGAFFTLAFVVAGVNKLLAVLDKKHRKEEQ